MKYSFTFFFGLIFLAFASCARTSADSQKQVKQTEPPGLGPKASWESVTVDLGDVPYKMSKDAKFVLKNTGNEPLIITYASANCGCLTFTYPEEPILPGKSANISVTFDGTGKGPFRKSITIQTNASEIPTVLQITGKVTKIE
ncbi:MAG: DUF1573 domain-containing protein [Sphingobacteriia bacterium]|nr:DUF1573 domain-containing protein [Sphingobacteriia bacterium]